MRFLPSFARACEEGDDENKRRNREGSEHEPHNLQPSCANKALLASEEETGQEAHGLFMQAFYQARVSEQRANASSEVLRR